MRIDKHTKGFTLMELLIALAILGSLMMIAYPNYQNYLTKSRRAEGKTALLHVANLMERYFSVNHTYASATIGAGNTSTDLLSSGNTENNWYMIAISQQNATTYTLTATPQGIQASNDALCATFSLNHLGEKSQSGTGTTTECW